MTESNLTTPEVSRESAWSAVLGDYRDACTELHYAELRAGQDGQDVDPDAADDHARMACSLIDTPATHLAHLGQKIRAADNLLNLSGQYPALPAILLADICRLMGIEDGDTPPLPRRLGSRASA